VQHRPTHIAADLSGLFEVDDAVRVHPLASADSGAEAGGWRVSRGQAGLELSGDGDPIVALRLLCAVTWAAEPATATPGSEKVTASSASAAEALRRLGLADG
jgi:hypothetical protein